jgi:hypothetical protein
MYRVGRVRGRPGRLLSVRSPAGPAARVQSPASGVPTVSVLSVGTPAEIAAHGRQWLDANVAGAEAALIVCDGYVTIDGSKKDALVLDLQSYRPPAARMKMAVPYRPHHHDGGFVVHRPKFIVRRDRGPRSRGADPGLLPGRLLARNGARIWNACADQEW